MMVFITAADTEVLTAQRAVDRLPDGFPPVRLASTDQLQSVEDLESFLADLEAEPDLLVARVLGGKQYFETGLEFLAEHATDRDVPFVVLPGTREMNPELTATGTVPPTVTGTTFEYFALGGVANFEAAFRFLADEFLLGEFEYADPQPLPWHGLYHPDLDGPVQDLGAYADRFFTDERPVMAILFYRAHWSAGNLRSVDALIEEIEAAGYDPLPVFCYSMREQGERGSHGGGEVEDVDGNPGERSAVDGRSEARAGDRSEAQVSDRSEAHEGDLSDPDEGDLSEAHEGDLSDLDGDDRSDPDGERDGGTTPTVVDEYLTDADGETVPSVIVNTLSYHMGTLSREERATTTDPESTDFLRDLDVPVLQAMTSSSTVDEWEDHEEGLQPRDTAMNVAMPEFDGQIITNAASYREPVEPEAAVTGPVYRYTPVPDRTESIVNMADRHARLARTKNDEKKIAVLLTSFPSQNSRVGNAVGLDTPASVINVLEALREAGYETGEIPDDGDALIHELIDRGGYDKQFLTRDQMRQAPGTVDGETYGEWFDGFPEPVREEMTAEWDDPPGDVYRDGEDLYFAGIRFGNVFVGIQPPRGFGENPIAVYHSPDLVPTHHYAGFYRWLREEFAADAVVHAGKHGTLEWLPGKAVALSEECYPEVCNPDLPVFYPFIVNDPGEGSQAKRRLHSVVIDHLVPPMTTADTYGDLDRLQTLLDEYQQAEELDPKKLPQIREEIWQLLLENDLDEDLHVDERPEDFDEFTNEIDGYLCEIGALQIRGGLHVLGEPPTGEDLVHFLTALLRLDTEHVTGIRRAIADEYGIDYDAVLDDRGAAVESEVVPFVDHVETDAVRTRGDVEVAIEAFARVLVTAIVDGDPVERVRDRYAIDADSPIAETLTYVDEEVIPDVRATTDEIDHLLAGLDGGYVPPGPSGAPTRGMPELLPTGRNFYSVDVRAVPSPYAWEVGTDLAASLLETHCEAEGAYPESIGIVVWGTSNMRTKGDDIAEILALLGVKPEWHAENRRVEGLSVIPLSELGRPRIDVTVRISGFFRDAFPHVIDLLDRAVNMVADLEEPPEKNYVRKHAERDRQRHVGAGMHEDAARNRSRYRIFGSKPGTYGAGILPAINQRNWEDDEDLASIYLNWGGYAYTDEEYGSEAIEDFQERLSNVQVAVQNQDNREHDIFDSDDYLQFHGGMVASIRALRGEQPTAMFGDSSRPEDVEVRRLADEARRVFRSRVVNPTWMEGMREHGYKGALEMAATVDFLFGYDATAQVVDDWMYADVTEAYLFDAENREFLEAHNPWSIRSMSERLLEAMDRELWEDPDAETRQRLRELYLENEGTLEGRQE